MGNDVQMGPIIRKRRKALGITQEKLADLVGVTPPYLNRIERGKVIKPRPKLLKRIAECLQLEIGELIGYSELKECKEKIKFCLPKEEADLVIKLIENIGIISEGEKAIIWKILSPKCPL